MIRTFILVMCASVLVACSTGATKPLSPLKESFDKQQFSNGVEVFTYKVFFPEPKIVPADRLNRPVKETTNAKSLRLDDRLTQRLEAEGYCADGYRKLEQVVGYGNARIRGECL